jgi:hypothetical protein
MVDQAAPHGVLLKVRDLGLRLLAVNPPQRPAAAPEAAALLARGSTVSRRLTRRDDGAAPVCSGRGAGVQGTGPCAAQKRAINRASAASVFVRASTASA